jgi:hypothetical protein
VPVYVTELAPPSKRGVRHVHIYIFSHANAASESSGVSAVGNYVGYSNHVLHLIRLYISRRREGFPRSLGHSDASSCHPRHWPYFSSRKSSLASP